MRNILYFGTICNLDSYDEVLKSCSSKPSVAAIVFEQALLSGFKKNDVNIDVHSFPMIPSFPECKILYFGNKKEKLAMGYSCRWLRTINIPILKQISRKFDAKRIMKQWISENEGDGVILTYSIPPFLVKDIVKFRKKHSVKIVAIIPDLLRDMYINENNSFFTKLKKAYIKPALKVQDKYDAYIYLTEAMHDIVAPDKPYIVIEGISDLENSDNEIKREKVEPKVIMYAGMMHEKYGILNLVDAFELIRNEDVELWLFGDGTASDIIRERSGFNRRIKFFGTVSHDEILEYEKKAFLLVNLRNPKDEFTFYSFPSKTIEYMMSGTPLLSTKLNGIPNEYYDFIFSINDNSIKSIYGALIDILGYSEDELQDIGAKARQYIVENKNSYTQTRKIIEFLEGIA